MADDAQRRAGFHERPVQFAIDLLHHAALIGQHLAGVLLAGDGGDMRSGNLLPRTGEAVHLGPFGDIGEGDDAGMGGADLFFGIGFGLEGFQNFGDVSHAFP